MENKPPFKFVMIKCQKNYNYIKNSELLIDKEWDVMSKYNALWEYIQGDGSPSMKLSFDEIHNIAGIDRLFFFEIQKCANK